VELTICRVYYQAHDPSVIGQTGDVPEEYCKLEIVQEKLAYLMGILETIKSFVVSSNRKDFAYLLTIFCT
jgi:hypothetical protein